MQNLSFEYTLEFNEAQDVLSLKSREWSHDGREKRMLERELIGHWFERCANCHAAPAQSLAISSQSQLDRGLPQTSHSP